MWRFIQRLSPYLLLELLLPGGTVVAMLLFLYGRWKGTGSAHARRVRSAPPTAGQACVAGTDL